VHAETLTIKQRTALVESAKTAYTAEHDAARAAVRTADGANAKAIAEYGVARAKATLKLLDSISGS